MDLITIIYALIVGLLSIIGFFLRQIYKDNKDSNKEQSNDIKNLSEAITRLDTTITDMKENNGHRLNDHQRQLEAHDCRIREIEIK